MGPVYKGYFGVVGVMVFKAVRGLMLEENMYASRAPIDGGSLLEEGRRLFF